MPGPERPASRPRGVGLVGCGEVAREFHIPALGHVAELELVALASPDAAGRARCAAAAGVSRLYDDHTALLEDPAVELVGVCVPAESHVEVASAALAAGRHVLIEKPPALGLDEWDRLMAVADAAPGVTMLAVNMRWLESVRRARELIRAGGLGEVRTIQTTLTSDRSSKRRTSSWRSERLRGGGALVEKAVHHLDLWRFLLESEVDEVLAVATGADEDVCLTARLEGGALATTLASDRLPHRNEVVVAGSAGRMRVLPDQYDGVWLDPDPHAGRGSRSVRLAADLLARVRRRGAAGAYLDSFAAQWRHLAQAARLGTPVEPGLDSGRRLLQTVLAAAESTTTGAAVRRVDAPRSLTPAA